MALDRPLNLTFLEDAPLEGRLEDVSALKEAIKELEKKVKNKDKTIKSMTEFLSDKGFSESSLPIEWISKVYKEKNLTELADKSGSDKGFSKHLYTTVYQEIVKPEKVKHLLEIGLLCHADQKSLGGGNSFDIAPSLEMWCEYLPNAEIFGFDIQDFSKAKGNWKAFIQGDQSKREDLDKILEKQKHFDVIIDDALHASKHQQITFSYLFKNVNSGGFYIIEDLHYQPEGEGDEIKTQVLLKELASTSKWKSKHSTKDEASYIEKNIDEIYFFDSMKFPRKTSRDAICVILKK